jgi:hypothetical protein
MGVEYRAKAKGTMHATAMVKLPEVLGDKQALPVNVTVADDARNAVFGAVITIWVTARA